MFVDQLHFLHNQLHADRGTLCLDLPKWNLSLQPAVPDMLIFLLDLHQLNQLHSMYHFKCIINIPIQRSLPHNLSSADILKRGQLSPLRPDLPDLFGQSFKLLKLSEPLQSQRKYLCDKLSQWNIQRHQLYLRQLLNELSSVFGSQHLLFL